MTNLLGTSPQLFPSDAHEVLVLGSDLSLKMGYEDADTTPSFQLQPRLHELRQHELVSILGAVKQALPKLLIETKMMVWIKAAN
jgi:hypothetical protein